MVIRPLTEALQKVASEELNEDPQRIASDLESFKNWIAEQPHMKSRTDDQFLIAFLRNCKYDLEAAQQKLDNYYAYIEKNPEILKRPKLDEERIRKLLKCGVVVYLPQPVTEVGPRVVLVRNGAFDPKEFTFTEVSQFRQLLQDIIFLEDDIAVVGGLIYIMDFGDVTASHYLQVNPALVRKISQYTEECVPLNLKANHFINTASGFAPLYNLAKTFMPAKTQNKMFVHGSDREELFKAIPKEILPQEYGGESSSLQVLIDQWEQTVLSYVQYFQDNDKYGVDETLRVKNSDMATRSKFLGIF
ncbi:alpha-tocopherol transfer protein-like [Calliphora vicina]|uniref:alpha-tocopherol transfer protein-like n=1 Tax=Calliphora vicina TaxID=7373 RepID=UPI00325A76E8